MPRELLSPVLPGTGNPHWEDVSRVDLQGNRQDTLCFLGCVGLGLIFV